MVPCHAGGAGFNMIATVSDLSLTLLLLHVDSYGNKHQEDGAIFKLTSLNVFPAIDIAVDMIADYVDYELLPL